MLTLWYGTGWKLIYPTMFHLFTNLCKNVHPFTIFMTHYFVYVLVYATNTNYANNFNRLNEPLIIYCIFWLWKEMSLHIYFVLKTTLLHRYIIHILFPWKYYIILSKVKSKFRSMSIHDGRFGFYVSWAIFPIVRFIPSFP